MKHVKPDRRNTRVLGSIITASVSPQASVVTGHVRCPQGGKFGQDEWPHGRRVRTTLTRHADAEQCFFFAADESGGCPTLVLFGAALVPHNV